MKGAVFEGKHKIIIKEDLIKPSIEEDEVLIKTKKVAICGSDVGSYETGGPYFPGIVLGHEFSGEIVEVGEKVKKLKVGTRIML
ncbi:MAG: alcohol dehydrogenase catalytic domain-containing protein [Promethearchaeota archaeon]